MKLEIPEGPFDGAIFDCDGTLVDTMPLHYKMWLKALARNHAPFHFEEDYFYHLGGTATEHVVDLLNERYGAALDSRAIAHEKEEYFVQALEEASALPLIDAVVAVARQYKAEGKPIGVVSGGMSHVVLHTLDITGLRDLFPVVVTPEQVAPGRGKPAPDMFLLCAEKLGLDPRKTLVFEDAPTGIAAGRAAGMAVAVVPRPT